MILHMEMEKVEAKGTIAYVGKHYSQSPKEAMLRISCIVL